MVVRGWVPEDADASSPADPALVPEGTLSVTARLRTAEPVLDRVPPEGQAHSVNPTQIASQLGLDTNAVVIGAFGELAQEEPAADRPQPLPAPETGLGPHLSYAFQWWIFALFFPGALIFRLRRQFQDLAAEEAEAAAGATPGEGDADAAVAIDPADPHAAPSPRTAARTGARDTADHRPRRAVRARRRGQDEEEEDALIDQQQP